MVHLPGGKPLQGESPSETALRETREETGAALRSPSPAGVLEYVFFPSDLFTLHLIRAEAPEMRIRPCEETKPFWIDTGAIPWDRMWPDSMHWLPLALEGHVVQGTFSYRGRILETHSVSVMPR